MTSNDGKCIGRWLHDIITDIKERSFVELVVSQNEKKKRLKPINYWKNVVFKKVYKEEKISDIYTFV